MLKQIPRADERCSLPQPSGSGLRTPDPSGGFNCPGFHVLNSRSTLVWAFVQVWLSAFCQQYWFWLYNAPVIPILKTRGKAQLKSLIKADKNEWVLELRIETRSPEVSLLGTFPLPSSFESLFSPGAGRWKSGQYADMFSFPEGNQALQAQFTEAASPLRLPRFEVFAALTGHCKIQQSDLCSLRRGWQSTGTAHYLKTGSHNMFLWTSETNLWNGPWWELGWPELPSENVPIPPFASGVCLLEKE